MSEITAGSTITSTACILCGERDHWRPMIGGVVDYLSGETFNIVRCDMCGLRMTHPFPAESELAKYYPPRYRGDRHSFTGQMRVKLRQRALEKFFPPNFRGRVLDIGAGDGSFALAMKAAGWQVSATEIDPQSVSRLRGQGIDAKLSSEAEVEGFGEPFDAVTAWHVLEHVARPGDLARWVRPLLKSDGIFQPTVPNAACLQAKIFGRQWMHLDVPRHLFHFTPQTLRRLLESTGFSPIARSVFAIEYDWFGVIQSALNPLCGTANVLFERLTNPPAENSRKPAALDVALSYALAGPLAAISLPPMLLAWALGDGATLTISAMKSRQ